MAKTANDRRDLRRPAVPVSLGDMKWSKTGSWRYVRPVYENKTPPCSQACPAGIDIAGFLASVEAGKIRKAWLRIKEESPFPAVCGRVCPHPCENRCNRGHYDEAVSINRVERFVADAARGGARRHVDRLERKREKVAVIGSGPAGLSCAYHLARLGYNPEVLEALPLPGGTLRYGIPAYRLPGDVLDREIADVEAFGVTIRTRRRVDRGFFDRRGRAYQAVFVATGAQKAKILGIPGEEGAGVVSGHAFLREVKTGSRPRLGKRVAVIGGGNTALDAARTARRLGSEAIVLYRRDRDEMPAFAAEIEEALDEGIRIEFLTQPVRIIGEEGRVVGLECVRTRLDGADEKGRRYPVPVEGSNFTMDIAGVLVAIGEYPETIATPADLPMDGECLIVEDGSRWESQGIFFGGDLVSPVRSVAHAIGSGKRGAIAIDAFFKREDPSHILEMVRIGETGEISMAKYLDGDFRAVSRHVVSFDELNLAYFGSMRRAEERQAPISRRIRDFREVNRGLSRWEARYEAARCFSCGTCNDCEICYVFCPDVSVLKKMRKLRHAIDYETCKGCGICFTECPRSAISMEEERR